MRLILTNTYVIFAIAYPWRLLSVAHLLRAGTM